MQAAINKGADLKARDATYSATPLMFAASYNPNSEVISVLLKAGADVKAQDGNGRTALMWAAADQNPDVITVLLKAGADAKAKDMLGEMALELAQNNANHEQLKDTGALKQLEEASR